MKQVINSKYLSVIIFILLIATLVKLAWIVISMLFLPSTGEEFQKPNKAKQLYYRVKLNNASQVIPSVQPVKVKTNTVSSMKGYRLLGLYNSKETLVVTVEKGRKTKILSKGEEFNGFKLMSAGSNFVIFEKNAEEFKLMLENIKKSKNSSPVTRTATAPKAATQNKGKIVDEDGVKQIPRNLLTSYTKDTDKIWKDVGLAPYKKNGQASGFKVNFVKKGSDIEKLGLKRGDILKAVNGESLDLSSAMNFYNDINNLENLTLTVERNGRSEDLEYEIQ